MKAGVDLTYVSSFDFQFVVDAWREVVQDDHLTVGRESVLLFDPDAHQSLDGRAARDPAHSRRPDRVFII